MLKSLRVQGAVVVAALLLASAMAARAQQAGPIRVWGHGHRGKDYALTLLKAWETAYQKQHPGVTFVNELDGNASAMGGLWTGSADLALLDREASFIEVDGYQQGTGHDPFGVKVAAGSVSTAEHAPALQLYVHASNPLTALTMGQVDGLFDADHRRHARRLRTWGDVGLEGAWAAQPVHLYSLPIQSATVQFFERAAMKGSQKFSAALTVEPTNAAVIEAVKKDKYGLAVVDAAAKDVKAVALAQGDDATAAVVASEAAITKGQYPLARTLYMYSNRPKGGPVDARVAGFLEFVVSDEGQEIVARTGGYLPLPAVAANASREALR